MLKFTFILGYKGKLLLAGPAFDLILAFEGLGSCIERFFVNKLNRQATPRTSTAFLAIMFDYSTVYVGGCAGVEGAIGTTEYVDVPHGFLLGPSTRLLRGLAQGQFLKWKSLSAIISQRGFS